MKTSDSFVNCFNCFKYLVISDVHLGHQRTTTEYVLKNLNQIFEHTDIDVLFIAGDLYDRRLVYGSVEAYQVDNWVIRLLKWCKKYNIIIRVLEGTPSHDLGQPKQLVVYEERLKLGLDIEYIDTIKIEYMKKIDKYILYLPDESDTHTRKIEQRILSLMKDKNISSIDIGILHGQFRYQLNPIAHNDITLDESFFLSIITGYIHVGHIHTFSVYKRIIAQGSFDRLKQGEEEPKGYVKVSYDEGGYKYDFIENPHAKIYATIKVRYVDANKTLSFLDKRLSQYPPDSYIRLSLSPNNPFYHDFVPLKVRYPMLNLTRLHHQSNKLSTLVLNPVKEAPIAINKDNIKQLLEEEIGNMTKEEKRLFNMEMESMLNNILNC